MPVPSEHRPQRKLVDIEVVETSGVDHPAHLHPGWVVMKADGRKPAEPHMHLTEAHYLRPGEEDTAKGIYGSDDLKPGTSKEMSKDGTLGRDDCGCLYMKTSGTIARAEEESFKQHLARATEAARTEGPWNGMLTKEEVEFLMGGPAKK